MKHLSHQLQGTLRPAIVAAQLLHLACRQSGEHLYVADSSLTFLLEPTRRLIQGVDLAMLFQQAQ